MAYKGYFTPKNFTKYKGNPSKIVFRSLWERKIMQWCDQDNSVLDKNRLSDETIWPMPIVLDVNSDLANSINPKKRKVNFSFSIFNNSLASD